MAKVSAPFQIEGTLQDLEFYVDQDNINRVRVKSKKGITSKEFINNPIFHKARNHGKEFGRCAIKACTFRMIAQSFLQRAKDGSFAGRANKLMLDILREDTANSQGQRTVINGLENPEARTYFIGFEGNKLRPLGTVLKTEWTWNNEKSIYNIKNFLPSQHLDWPQDAQMVHLAIARANWDYINDYFKIEYSSEITFEKDDPSADLSLQVDIPSGTGLELTYLFIGFSTMDRKKIKELKRCHNTATIIWSQ